MVERKKSTPKVAPKKAAEPKVSVKKEVAPAKKEIPPKKSASRKTKTPVVEVVSDSESETEILEPIAPPEKKKASTPKKVAPRKGKKVAAPEPEDDGFELLGSPQKIADSDSETENLEDVVVAVPVSPPPPEKKKIGRPKGSKKAVSDATEKKLAAKRSSKKGDASALDEDEVEFSLAATAAASASSNTATGPKIRRKPFSSEITKAFVFKVALDVLSGVQRCTLSFTKNSIGIRQTDDQDTILYDVEFPRKHLRAFVCKKPLAVSFNLKRMQGLLKNVKKKDSILLEIIEEGSNYKISVTIRPEGLRKNTRFESNSMVCQLEKNYVMDELPDGGYGHPMVIEATDFQKIKKMAAVSKVVNVTIQGSNYISFQCDAGVMYDSEIGFGELLDGDSSSRKTKCTRILHEEGCECVCEECGEYSGSDGACECVCDGCDVKYSKGCMCVCDGCDELLRECECECLECGVYLLEGCACAYGSGKTKKTSKGQDSNAESESSDGSSSTSGSEGDSDDESADEESPEPEDDERAIFRQRYYSSILGKLVKLPSLCSSMQFSYPRQEGYPLLIEAACSQNNYFLGTMKIYIKDVDQILREEEIKAKEELLAPSLASSKKKKVT